MYDAINFTTIHAFSPNGGQKKSLRLKRASHHQNIVIYNYINFNLFVSSPDTFFTLRLKKKEERINYFNFNFNFCQVLTVLTTVNN